VDYAKKPTKAKDDPSMIEHRKRMLVSFLNKCLRHEILSRDSLFHRFLEVGEWVDVLYSTQTPARKERSLTANVGPAKKLRNPDLKFIEHEQINTDLLAHWSDMEKVSKRLKKKFGELAGIYGELGALLNAFSLNETTSTSSLRHIIERTGQAADSTHLATESFVSLMMDDYHPSVCVAARTD
jgi:sorting nexin-4